jgi:hypothetical protein
VPPPGSKASAGRAGKCLPGGHGLPRVAHQQAPAEPPGNLEGTAQQRPADPSAAVIGQHADTDLGDMAESIHVLDGHAGGPDDLARIVPGHDRGAIAGPGQAAGKSQRLFQRLPRLARGGFGMQWPGRCVQLPDQAFRPVPQADALQHYLARRHAPFFPGPQLPDARYLCRSLCLTFTSVGQPHIPAHRKPPSSQTDPLCTPY